MPKKTKLLLISPSNRGFLTKSKFFGRYYFSPIAGVAVLASLTPPDVEVSIIDEVTDPIDYSTDANLIGISCMTNNVTSGYEIADKFKSLGKTVVMGGVHITYRAEEALLHSDAVVMGEAENIWQELLNDFQNGTLKKKYQSKELVKSENIPPLQNGLVDMSKYLMGFIQTSRGCPYNCEFCCESDYKGSMYRFRNIDKVVEEAREIQNRNFLLGDVNVFGDPQYYKKLFKSWKPYKFKWSGAASAEMANDDEMLDLAAESGCTVVNIGFESISKKTLNNINKGFNKPENYKKVIQKVQDRGIGVAGLFIFGFDDDDETVFEETLNFAKEANIDIAVFGTLTPYPGTQLYNRLKREGRILTEEWSQYDSGKLVFKPKRLSMRTIEEGRLWAFKEFYSYKDILSRAPIGKKVKFLPWFAGNLMMLRATASVERSQAERVYPEFTDSDPEASEG